MAYLGNAPAEAYTSTVKNTFNGDGSTTAFTLSQPSTTNNLRVVVENVIQDPSVAYTVDGTTLTFTSAPPSGTANIYAVHLGPATQTAVPPSEINNATTYTSDLTVQGDLTVDTNTLHVDSANNRVGVGTATPSSLLHVSSSDGDIVKISGSTKSLYFRPDTAGCMIATSTGQLGTGIYWNDTSNYLYFQTNSTEAARFNSSGNLVFPNGKGIDFSASAGGNASSSILDDYEEGVWSPYFSDSNGNAIFTVSPNVNFAHYTKVGRYVTASCYFDMPGSGWTTNAYYGGSGSGVYISGLPFTAYHNGSNNYYAGTVGWYDAWYNWDMSGYGYCPMIYTVHNTTRMAVVYPSTQNVIAVKQSHVNNGNAGILLTSTYFTSA